MAWEMTLGDVSGIRSGCAKKACRAPSGSPPRSAHPSLPRVVAVAWAIWESPRNALLFGGIALAYVSIAYPEKLSIRRAALSGLGLAIGAVGVAFF